MESDLISVLIPAYNVEKYLARCLRSVLQQTYQNLEIVIVDDGSTDNTFDLAKKFADQDARIVLLQKLNENNVARARNFLLDHCHGKYCVWVDSDDSIKPDYVEKLHQVLVENQADLSVCGFSVRTLPLSLLPTWFCSVRNYQGNEIAPRIIYKAGVMLWNKMYRVDLINGQMPLRFEPDCCYGEDLLFNLQYLHHCQKISITNTKLYLYSRRAGSEMHQKFSDKHVHFMNQLLDLCAKETDPIIRDTIYGWAAFGCCGLAFLANKRNYFDAVSRMKQFAYQYRRNLYKNRLAKFRLKLILWVGLKTWCRPKRQTRKLLNKGN